MAALKLAGISKTRWCRDHAAVSLTHLDKVLDGADRSRPGSPELNAAIDDVIATYLPDSPEAAARQPAGETAA